MHGWKVTRGTFLRVNTIESISGHVAGAKGRTMRNLWQTAEAQLLIYTYIRMDRFLFVLEIIVSVTYWQPWCRIQRAFTYVIIFYTKIVLIMEKKMDKYAHGCKRARSTLHWRETTRGPRCERAPLRLSPARHNLKPPRTNKSAYDAINGAPSRLDDPNTRERTPRRLRPPSDPCKDEPSQNAINRRANSTAH